MAYTPINWQTGDTITAEKLNKMDNGWSVTTETQTVFDDEVTTEEGAYGNEAEIEMSQITAESITVTFNNVEYTCPAIYVDGNYGYGGVTSSWSYDFTDFPFAIVSTDSGAYIATQTAGTYTFEIVADVTTAEVSSSFEAAVASPSVAYKTVSQCISQETVSIYTPYFGFCNYRNGTAVTVPANSKASCTFGYVDSYYDWSNCTKFVITDNYVGDGLIPAFISNPSGSSSITVKLFNPTASDITLSANGATITVLGFGRPDFPTEITSTHVVNTK